MATSGGEFQDAFRVRLKPEGDGCAVTLAAIAFALTLEEVGDGHAVDADLAGDFGVRNAMRVEQYPRALRCLRVRERQYGVHVAFGGR